ncbi:MAG TPA: thioredoxin fold domain-containing protein [Gammaproteobacteria bacterium]|nr:thioredoxin fold domain-containing protein [Gammaproteobacteria bacterium]
MLMSVPRKIARCLSTVPLLLLLGHAQAEQIPPPDALDAGMINPGYVEKPDWFVNSFLDIREDVREAAAVDRRVLLYFYQDGCPYCKKLLDTNLALKATETRMREDFAVIAINMWGDREVTGFGGESTTEKAFAKSLRVMFTPTLLFLDEAGNVVLRVNGYYPPHKFNAALEYAASHDGRDPDFRAWYAAQAPAPARGVLHREPGWLPSDADLAARPGDRPLLVMFEQLDCAPCDELHLDILQRPESREQLARFDVVLLDMWSKAPVARPDGRTSSAAEWARELNLQYAPSLVFFDASGKEVFRTEAWLRSFHIQSAMDYAASGSYQEQPDFQRYISARANALEAQGVHVNLLD